MHEHHGRAVAPGLAGMRRATDRPKCTVIAQGRSGPAGGTHVLMRLMAVATSRTFDRQHIVEDRSGARGRVAAQAVACRVGLKPGSAR